MRYVSKPRTPFVPDTQCVVGTDDANFAYCFVTQEGFFQPSHVIGDLNTPEEVLLKVISVKDRSSKSVIWAYDICYFCDAINLKLLCEQFGWEIESVIDLDPPGVIKLKKGRRSVHIWDVRNWLNVSAIELVSLAQQRGVKHWGPDWNCAKLKGFAHDVFIASCVVVMEIITSKEFVCDVTIRPTCASQALELYKRRLGCSVGAYGLTAYSTWSPTWTGQPKLLPLVHCDDDTRDLERKAFFGGVVSSFRPGCNHTEVHIYDCNSMYLHIGDTMPFPAKYHLRTASSQEWHDHVIKDCYGGFCACEIRSSSVPYPVRTRKGIRYAKGHFCTYLTAPEYSRALSCDHVASFFFGIVYKQEYILKRHSIEMIRVKRDAAEQGNVIKKELAKRVGNALWGKFGQKNETWHRVKGVTPPEDWSVWAMIDYDEHKAMVFRSLNGVVWRRADPYDPQHCSPIICATMTAYARDYMLLVMDHLSPDTILYSSVDSLHLTPKGSDELKDSPFYDKKAPGKFSLREILNNVVYSKPGWYRSDEKVVHAGVPRDAYMDDDGEYRYSRQHTLRHYLSTPSVSRLGSEDVCLTPPMSSRRKSKPPQTHADLWETYNQRSVDMAILEE